MFFNYQPIFVYGWNNTSKKMPDWSTGDVSDLNEKEKTNQPIMAQHCCNSSQLWNISFSKWLIKIQFKLSPSKLWVKSTSCLGIPIVLSFACANFVSLLYHQTDLQPDIWLAHVLIQLLFLEGMTVGEPRLHVADSSCGFNENMEDLKLVPSQLGVISRRKISKMWTCKSLKDVDEKVFKVLF